MVFRIQKWVGNSIYTKNPFQARYLDFGQLGIGKYKLEEYKECFDKLSSGKISKASFVFE
jgi:hypothetical protein